jgi:hypothetical protein
MRPISVLPSCTDLPAEPAPLDEPLDPDALAALSREDLVGRLTNWAGRVAAGEARLLLYLGEFDERRAWSGIGILSCAHWLSWRLGLSLSAAYEKVRIASALRILPLIRTAFSNGEVSYSQVRALTRICTPENEGHFLPLARHATGSQLDRLVRGIIRARRGRDRDEARRRGETPEPVTPQVRTRYDADGNLTITFRCAAEDGAVMLAALDAARYDLDHPGDSSAEESPDASTPPPAAAPAAEEAPCRAGLADGLFALARRYLDVRGQEHPGRARRDRSKLVVQIDPLSGWARLPDGELLPPGTPGIDLPAGPLRPFSSADRHAHDAGRTSRDVPQALRDLLGTLDGECCRYPGCTRTRNLHAHHVLFWADGGRTDLDNTVLLCAHHHQVLHDAGFRLALDPRTRAVTVHTPAGGLVPRHPDLPTNSAAELDPHSQISPRTLPPSALDRLDLHYAIGVMMQWAA